MGCADTRRGEGSAADSSAQHSSPHLGYKIWDFGPIASLTLQLSPRCRWSWPSSATSAAPRPLPPLCPRRATQGSAVPLSPAGEEGRSPGQDEDGAAFTTLLGLKTECTQRSISLVSSPWGSPQITTCPETPQMAKVWSRQALVAPQHSSAALALPV